MYSTKIYMGEVNEEKIVQRILHNRSLTSYFFLSLLFNFIMTFNQNCWIDNFYSIQYNFGSVNKFFYAFRLIILQLLNTLKIAYTLILLCHRKHHTISNNYKYDQVLRVLNLIWYTYQLIFFFRMKRNMIKIC